MMYPTVFYSTLSCGCSRTIEVIYDMISDKNITKL